MMVTTRGTSIYNNVPVLGGAGVIVTEAVPGDTIGMANETVLRDAAVTATEAVRGDAVVTGSCDIVMVCKGCYNRQPT